jgi:3',5'-cyclic-AMP phosphodiesterase
MPISLKNSRREFMETVAATAAISLVSQSGYAQARQVEENRFALLADTHIHAQLEKESRGAIMGKNLQAVVSQLLQREKPVHASFILGDCAFGNGQKNDYVTLRELLMPLLKTEHELVLALGNHDDRANILTAFPATEKDIYATIERRITIVKSELANWFLLDSLDMVDKTPGRLGEKQLDWLTEVLDAHTDKPALLGVHHNIMTQPPAPGQVVGLLDSEALLNSVAPRKHVKAIFFGHTHDWKISEYEGIHLINLPPVAYVFKEGKPNGWADCLLQENSCQLTLHCHDTKHAEHEKTHEFKWRT